MPIFPRLPFQIGPIFPRLPFQIVADFSKTTFSDIADFFKTTFSDIADFSSASFQGKHNPDFSKCRGQEDKEAILFTFTDARFLLFYPPLFHQTSIQQGSSFFQAEFIYTDQERQLISKNRRLLWWLLWLKICFVLRMLKKSTYRYLLQLKRAFSRLKVPDRVKLLDQILG